MTEDMLSSGDDIGLAAGADVYRAVLRERYIKNGIRYQVFTRRDVDQDGISVYEAASCDRPVLCASFAECFGVLTLQVGSVRMLGEGLDVVLDAIPDDASSCNHANIIGVPFTSQDPGRAEYIATHLVKLIKETWRP